jgi:hypothetical protein
MYQRLFFLHMVATLGIGVVIKRITLQVCRHCTGTVAVFADVSLAVVKMKAEFSSPILNAQAALHCVHDQESKHIERRYYCIDQGRTVNTKRTNTVYY